MQQLKVHSSNRFLALNDGTPFYWMGDTAWELFHRGTRAEIQTYLQNRATNRFNVVQCVIIAEKASTTSGSAAGQALTMPNFYGDHPINNRDPGAPLATTTGNNPANATEYDYWDHMDYAIQLAESLGIYMAILPCWGRYLWTATGQPANVIFNTTNAYTYGYNVGLRYKDQENIIWVLGGDRQPSDQPRRDIINSMAAGIKASGATQPITYHTWGNDSSSNWFHNESWLAFNMIQSGHNSVDRDNYRDVYQDYTKSGTVKPTVDAEPRYEDGGINFTTANGFFSAFDVRQAAYWASFAGAMGHTYGHNYLWQWREDTRYPGENGGYPAGSWLSALGREGGLDMQWLRNLMESRKFYQGIPDTTFVTNAYTGGSHIRSFRGLDFAFVYSPFGYAINVNMGRISGATTDAKWYNPRTGSVTTIGNYTNSGTRTFTPSSSGRGNDWVLVLDDPAASYPDPGDWEDGGVVDPPEDTIPTTPVVTLGTVTHNSIAISWTASTDDAGIASYDIYNFDVFFDYVSGSTLSYVLTGLTANTAYKISVKAKDPSQNYSLVEAYTETTTLEESGDVTAPTAPVLSYVSKTAGTISVEWTESTDAVGVHSYDVYLDDVFYNNTVVGVTADPLVMTIEGLSAGVEYDIKVRAKDAAGNLSDFSNVVTQTTVSVDVLPPTVPTGLSYTERTETTVSLSWLPSHDNIGVVGYEIYVNGVFEAYAGWAPYVITGLTANTEYTFTVAAYDDEENTSAQSDGFAVTTLGGATADTTDPTPAYELTVKQISPSVITITWFPALDNVRVDHYEIRSGSDVLATMNTTSYVLPGLEPGTAYSLVVRAYDAAGNWADSDAVEFTMAEANDGEEPISVYVHLTNGTVDFEALENVVRDQTSYVAGLVDGGLIDNTATIQSAIDLAWNSGGGTVVIPNGIYAHTGLFARTNVTVMGQSPVKTILRNTHASNPSWSARGAGSSFCHNWALKTISLTTATTAQTGQHGIDLHLSHSFKIEDVNIDNHDYGVRENISWYGYFENVKSQGNNYGWYALPYEIASVPNTKVNCHALYNAQYGIYIEDSITQCTFLGGGVEWNGVGGIKILGNGTRALLFTGMNIEGNLGHAVEIGDDSETPANIRFQNCTIRRDTTLVGSVGVRLKKGVGIELQNIKFFNYDTAIETDNSASFSFSFCTFDSSSIVYDFDGTTISAANNIYTIVSGDWDGIVGQTSQGFQRIKPTGSGVDLESTSIGSTTTVIDEVQYYFFDNYATGFTSVPANSTVNITLACEGVLFSDVVSMNVGFYPAGIIWNCYVSAEGEVTLRLANVTTSAVTVDATQDLRVVRTHYSYSS